MSWFRNPAVLASVTMGAASGWDSTPLGCSQLAGSSPWRETPRLAMENH